ncbi:hypothetical protein TSUD_344230 [Trifolium subterraneum]|nr:hypothetical protein TSUD_344230 [Trifolium subterraneum]
MASKRTSHDEESDHSTKNLHVPSTKRIKHGNSEQQQPLFPTTMIRSATNDNNIIAFCFEPLIRKVVVTTIHILTLFACMEGRSEPFRVLDVRGKANEKHDRPSVNDEVWRLKGIGLLNTDPTSFNTCQPEMSPFRELAYLFGEENIYSGFDGVSQTGQFVRSNSWEQFNAFDNSDGAGPSNHSSSLNFAVRISSNGKPKKDWQKIRSALKWFMLYTRKRGPLVIIYTP